MKAIGFIDVHDANLNCSEKVASNFFTIQEIANGSPDISSKIFSYLTNGTTLLKYISPVYAADGECIGPNIIYTDGIWVWPSYYLFYLKKYPATKIAKEFVAHIQINNGLCSSIPKSEQNYIEYLLAKMLGVRVNSNTEMLANIQPFINERGEKIVCYNV